MNKSFLSDVDVFLERSFFIWHPHSSLTYNRSISSTENLGFAFSFANYFILLQRRLWQDQQHGLAEAFLVFVLKGGRVRPSFDLTPSQEECLLRLQNRIDVAYDSSIPEHQEAFNALWKVAFLEEELRGLKSEQWKKMGWQGKYPSTDFSGGGFISLENLLYFVRNFSKSFQDLLRKTEGDRAIWEYPFAVAGVNITFTLI